MKSAEEILKQEIVVILRDNISFSGQTGQYVIHGAVSKTVDLIRQQAEAFAEWAAKRHWSYDTNVNEWHQSGSAERSQTISQLYDKYLEYLSKHKTV